MAKDKQIKEGPEPIDLAPDDSRNRFLFLEENCKFYKGPPITDADREEAALIWDTVAKKSSPSYRVDTAKK